MVDDGDALEILAVSLDSDGTQQVTAVWDVLDLGERLADAVTWQAGVDSLLSMAAAQSCRQAIRYVPAPASGRPVVTPHPAPDALTRCARLLERVADILQAPAAGSHIQPDATARQAAAAHTAAAHQAFAALSNSPKLEG